MSLVGLSRLHSESFLRRLMLTYLIVWVLSPPLAYDSIWRVLAVSAAMVWLLLELRSVRSVVLRPPRMVVIAVCFVLYTFAVEVLVTPSPDIARHFQVWIMLFFLMVGESFRRGREEDARYCFWLILLILPVWEIGTLRGLIVVDDNVARVGTRSSSQAMELAGQGIGGFGLVYSVLLCLPFIAWMAINPHGLHLLNRSRYRRLSAWLLILANLMLATLMILKAGYAIALILEAAVICTLLFIRSRKRFAFAFSVCLTGLVVIGVSLSMEGLLRVLEPVVSETEYASKVSDLRYSLQAQQSLGTVEGRSERYGRSARLAIENPVLGTLNFTEVGKHSAILDGFAQYGVVIGALYSALLLHVPLALLRNRSLPIGVGFAFLVVALLSPLLNTVFIAWGLMLYVFSRGALIVLAGSPKIRGLEAADSNRLSLMRDDTSPTLHVGRRQ